MKIITIEEHYMSEKVNDRFMELNQPKDEVQANQAAFVKLFMQQGTITDIGERRIAFMDENGIDAQIIGYGNNQPMHIHKEDGAVELCRLANDELYAATKKYPGRFYGYATLPVDDVEASVIELERCIKELGFVGVMINGPFDGHFLDEERFFPIFEKAANVNEKRERVREAKAANPREVEVICLKSRYTTPGYRCLFNYYPQYDYFEVVERRYNEERKPEQTAKPQYKGKDIEIELNNEERIIISFKESLNIDVTIVEIIPKDKIDEFFFSTPNINYENNKILLNDKEIEIFHYPKRGGLHHSKGKIISLSEKDDCVFYYNLATKPGSSGSPIFLKGDNKILGIHCKAINDNIKVGKGFFIKIIIDIIKDYQKNGKGKEY
mgnify:CR=1 FL=1